MYDWDDVVLPVTCVPRSSTVGWTSVRTSRGFPSITVSFNSDSMLGLLQYQSSDAVKRIHTGYSGYHEPDGMLISIIGLPEVGEGYGLCFLGQLSGLWRRDREMQCDEHMI